MTKVGREYYLRHCDIEGLESDYTAVFKFISECLHTCVVRHTIILIDGHDAPLGKCSLSGFYEEMVSLIRVLFESALEINDNLEFTVVTGYLRISKKFTFRSYWSITSSYIIVCMLIEWVDILWNFLFFTGHLEKYSRVSGVGDNLHGDGDLEQRCVLHL